MNDKYIYLPIRWVSFEELYDEGFKVCKSPIGTNNE